MMPLNCRAWFGASSLLLALAAAVGLSGCGKGASIEGVVPVTGKVTLNDQPLVGAQVTFVPASSDGARAAASSTDASGNYSLITNLDKGAVPGKYKVIVIYYTRPDGSPITTTAEGLDITQLEASGEAVQSLPANYSDPEMTELSFEVKASGGNVYDIPLKK